MDNKNIKDAEIKIRISKQEKERLQDKLKELGMSLSSYILSKCMTDTDKRIQLIPDAVETWDSYNEILHIVKSTQDAGLIKSIENIINRRMPKNQ